MSQAKSDSNSKMPGVVYIQPRIKNLLCKSNYEFEGLSCGCRIQYEFRRDGTAHPTAAESNFPYQLSLGKRVCLWQFYRPHFGTI